MATTFLFDSQHAQNLGTPHDCMFTLTKSIDVPSSTIVLDSCIIPNLRYNINSQNNTFYIKKNGGSTLTVTVTPGNYTYSELLNALDTLLTAAPISFAAVTLSLNTNTDIVSIDVGADTISIESGSILTSEILGFTDTVTAGSIITGTYPMRLDGTTYIDVEILDFPTRCYSSYGTRSILTRIPITSGYGTVINHVNPHGNNGVEGSVGSFQQIQIRLVDDRGRLFILPKNAHVSFTFYVTPAVLD